MGRKENRRKKVVGLKITTEILCHETTHAFCFRANGLGQHRRLFTHLHVLRAGKVSHLKRPLLLGVIHTSCSLHPPPSCSLDLFCGLASNASPQDDGIGRCHHDSFHSISDRYPKLQFLCLAYPRATCHSGWKRALHKLTTHQPVVVRVYKLRINPSLFGSEITAEGEQEVGLISPPSPSIPSASYCKPAPRRTHALSGSQAFTYLVYTTFP
ncbi:hypothetical protein QBC45DRAFT_205970 [Copromyces sp. CBS 386.78]|nr:hypothetical protein QBC45DRAFT_205970 [Copromyces sp. CBS 386.78]